MTSANIEKMAGKFEEKYDFNNKNDVFTDILDKLIKRKITGHNALNFVQDLIKFVGKEYQHTIFGIVNKDLKSQVSTSLINKVVPGTVKEFNVALAEKFKDTIGSKSHEVDFTKRKYQVSKKLDGLRTLSMNNSGKIEVFSRQGNEFLTLDNLKNDVNQLLEIAKKEFGKEFVLDGECCILNADGKEDFSLIMKEATRKNHTIKNPTIIAFDLIERKEFDALIGETPFSKRIERLEKLMSKHKFEHIKLVDHQNNITEEHFNQWRDKVKEND
ncbi:hypothetical protein FACS1894166_10010 [Bacilli bacterium]|nr:hypothetical protein FACS1894166_10010 [Bacilli bacterium]